MAYKKHKIFHTFTKRLASGGFVDVLIFIKEKENLRYNEIRNFLLDEKRLFNARSSVNLLINHLLELELIERKVLDTKPLKTSYKMTRKGLVILKHINAIQRTLGR